MAESCYKGSFQTSIRFKSTVGTEHIDYGYKFVYTITTKMD